MTAAKACPAKQAEVVNEFDEEAPRPADHPNQVARDVLRADA